MIIMISSNDDPHILIYDDHNIIVRCATPWAKQCQRIIIVIFVIIIIIILLVSLRFIMVGNRL